MNVDQAVFRKALLDPEMARPDGLVDGAGGPAGRRFDVYRNNVAASLTDALETAFPVVKKLVGGDNFKILAGVFLRQHPPATPVMMLYGKAMPEFLGDFGPTSGIGYLPDIARLELGLRESYHSADSKPIDPTRLQMMAPDQLMVSRFELAPSLRILRSAWPIHSIWEFNSKPNAPKPEMAAQDVLIARHEFDPVPHLLNLGDADCIEALSKGARLGDAVDTVSEQEFELSSTLALLISAGAFIKIKE